MTGTRETSVRQPGGKAAVREGWSDARIELLKKLWGQGWSAGQIRHEMGYAFSRSAIQGKINRLSLPRFGIAEHTKPPVPKRQAATPKASRSAIGLAGNGHAYIKPNAKTVQTPEERQRDDAGRLDGLRRFTGAIEGSIGGPFGSPGCKWPIGGEGADTQVCCAPRHEEGPYCEGHAKIAFVPSKHTGAARSHELQRSLRRYA